MTEPNGGAGSAQKPGSDFIGEARGLTLAGLLAALVGMVDAFSYLHLRGLFVSFMSGNSTKLGAALGRGNLAVAGTIAELIALFVLGAAVGQIVAGLVGQRQMTWVLISVAGLLAIAAVLRSAPEPMVVAMGALNASMNRAGNIPVSLTFVTGVLVRFGQGFGDFLTRRQTEWYWLLQASPWLELIAGATICAAIYVRIGEAAIWVPVIWAGLLAALSATISDLD